MRNIELLLYKVSQKTYIFNKKMIWLADNYIKTRKNRKQEHKFLSVFELLEQVIK